MTSQIRTGSVVGPVQIGATLVRREFLYGGQITWNTDANPKSLSLM
jgi:hypothetical protein